MPGPHPLVGPTVAETAGTEVGTRPETTLPAPQAPKATMPARARVAAIAARAHLYVMILTCPLLGHGPPDRGRVRLCLQPSAAHAIAPGAIRPAPAAGRPTCAGTARRLLITRHTARRRTGSAPHFVAMTYGKPGPSTSRPLPRPATCAVSTGDDRNPPHTAGGARPRGSRPYGGGFRGRQTPAAGAVSSSSSTQTSAAGRLCTTVEVSPSTVRSGSWSSFPFRTEGPRPGLIPGRPSLRVPAPRARRFPSERDDARKPIAPATGTDGPRTAPTGPRVDAHPRVTLGLGPAGAYDVVGRRS